MTRTTEHRDTTKSHTGDNYQKFLRAARDGDIALVIHLLDNGIKINVSNQIGLNALHLASKENHLDIVQELLRRGCDLEAVTKKGNTPLHIASLAGNFEIVKLLLDNKANVNRQSLIGFTPLYMAAQENHLDIVNLLLSRGANQALTTNDGFTPLAVALQQGHEKVVTILLEKDNKSKTSLPALHIAARKDDVNSVNLLLSNPNANVNHQSLTGFTPLHIAAHYGNMKVATCLIEKHADVNFQARNNITPLHVAAKWGKLNMARLLIKNGALIDCKTRDGLTPLHCAARSGYSDVCELLMESGAHPSAKTRNGLTPLHMAAQGNNDEVAKILILRGAGLEDITGDYLSPLHVAAHCGNEKVANILLQRQCDVNPRALNGFTPLHIACKKGREGMVDLLIKFNSQISSTTELGLSPLHVSAFIGNAKIVQKLLKAGSDVNQKTMRSETPLHLAVRNCQVEVAEILLANGAKVDAPAKDNETPLDIAVFTGHPELVVLLLKKGANPNVPTKDAYTALHFAAKTGNTEIIRSLLDSGANMLARNKKGFTCLHFAAKHGRVKAAKMLLSVCQKTFSQTEYYNFVNAKARNDLTAIHIATHYNKLDMVQLLIDNEADIYTRVSNGYSLLHMAAKFNHSDIATLILAQDLDQRKELPNAQSNCGFTPLHLAVQAGYCDLTSLLLQHGADVNYQSKNGLSALHLAAQEDRVQIAQILVAANCNLSPITLAGYTPLHTAAHFGQENMVRFLLNQKKVLVNEKISTGFTPLHLASQQGHNKVVHVLLDAGADPNLKSGNGLTAAHLAQQQHYISIFDQLKKVTTIVKTWEMIEITDELMQPEVMGEVVASDSEDETAIYMSPGKDQMQLHKEKEDKSLKDSVLPGEKNISDSLNASPTLKGKVLRPPGDGSHKLVEDNEDIWNQMTYIKEDQMNFKNTMPTSQGNSMLVEHNESFNASEMPIGKGDEFQMDTSYTEKLTKSMTNSTPQDLRKDNSNLMSTETNEWAIEATSNLDIERKPIESWRESIRTQEKKIIKFTAGKNSFLASFLVDARGCLLQAQRYPLLRIFIPPNAVTGPTRILMRLNRIPVAIPQLNDGDGLGCRIIEMSPVGIKFNSPVLFEIPYNADIESKDRELIVLRSENGSSWKEQTVDPSNHAIQQSLGVYFENVLPKEDLKKNRVHRILTHDIPQYFAIITRIKQDLILIGPDGGYIHSTVVPAVKSEFPAGALQKRIRVGLQAQAVDPQLISKMAGDLVSVSPIVTIEPRRRKFHKPIILTIPLPKSIVEMVQQKGKKLNLNEISSLRLLCSITGGTSPAFWEDITGSTTLNLVKNCAQFTTTVSARLWLFDCPNIAEVTEIATKIYRETIAVPYIGRMAVYGRRNDNDEAQLRCLMLTDDNIDKTLECQEGFHLLTTSPETRVLQNHTYWLETSGNLIPFTKATDQLSIGVRAFEENRLNLGVRMKNPSDQPRGRFAFVSAPKWHGTLPDAQKNTGTEKPIAILDVVLPKVGSAPKLPYSSENTPKAGHQQMNKTIITQNGKESNDLAKSDLNLKTIADNIKSDWERVAKGLGVDTVPIVKKHPDNSYDAAYATLEEWHRMNPKATGNQLSAALDKIGLNTVIKSSMNGAKMVQGEREIDKALTELEPEIMQELKTNTNNNAVVVNESVDNGPVTPKIVSRRVTPKEAVKEQVSVQEKAQNRAEIEDILADQFKKTVSPKIQRPSNDKPVVEEEFIKPVEKKRSPAPAALTDNDLIQPVQHTILKSAEPSFYQDEDYGPTNKGAKKDETPIIKPKNDSIKNEMKELINQKSMPTMSASLSDSPKKGSNHPTPKEIVLEEITMPAKYPICGEHESTWGKIQGEDCHDEHHSKENPTTATIEKEDKMPSKLKEKK